jgi:hypothetical protein
MQSLGVQVLVWFFLSVVLGSVAHCASSNASSFTAEGYAVQNWYGVSGELRERGVFSFRVIYSAGAFKIETEKTEGAGVNEVTHFVSGSDGTDAYTCIPFPNGVFSVSATPGPIPESQVIANVLWLAMCSAPYFDTVGPNPRFVVNREMLSYTPDELVFAVARQKVQPRIPLSAQVMTPGYHVLYDDQRRRMRVPMLPPFANGHLLNDYRVVSTTNVGSLVLPAEFTFRRLTTNIRQDTNLHVIAEHLFRVTSCSAAASSDLVTPSLVGVNHVLDYRFRDELGGGRVEYTVTNLIWLSRADARLRDLVAGAVKDYRRRLRAEGLAPYRSPFFAVVALLLVAFPLLLVEVRRRRVASRSTDNQNKHRKDIK